MKFYSNAKLIPGSHFLDPTYASISGNGMIVWFCGMGRITGE